MIELHLIGYTEDREHLVLDLDDDAEGRYTVRIDPDLLATVAQLRTERLARGMPVDQHPEPVSSEPVSSEPVSPEPVSSEPVSPEPVREVEEADIWDEPAWDEPSRPAPAASASHEPADVPRATRTTARAVPRRAAAPPSPTRQRTRTPPPRRSDRSPSEPPKRVEAPAPAQPAPRPSHRPAAEAVPLAKLSPAEIQARLRSGLSIRAVAKEAGTDTAWIEKWLPPIVAERERVLAHARRARLDVPRSRVFGRSVDRALVERGTDPASASWSVARRSDGRWSVTVRFKDRGRPRTATWTFDPGEDRLHAASPLATALAGPAERASRR